VVFAALILKEHVRIYRWSAVIIGFVGVLVVLSPHFSGEELTIAMASAGALTGVLSGLAGSISNAAAVIQTRRLTESETTSAIVFYFSLICAVGSLVTFPFGWTTPPVAELAALVSVGFLGGLGHIFLTESYRYAPASIIAPFDYTSMVWALVLGYFLFGELPTQMIIAGSAIIAASGMFVIWRERQLALQRKRAVAEVAAEATKLRTP
jgi:drug/metabolite transporter (DMT)-like permease